MSEYRYFDAVAYFKSKLDAICAAMGIAQYNVSSERVLNALDAREVVVSAMAGPVGAATASVTYEVSAWTNDPDEVMAMLNELARTESGKLFTSEAERGSDVVIYSVIPSYMTPTVMERDVEMGPNHGARVIQYATFGIIANVMDVNGLTYKGEEYEFAQASLNFTAQLSSNNKSGENLMKSTSSGAAFSLSLTLPSQSSALAIDIISVLIGAKPKNHKFDLSFKVGDANGIEASKSFIISSASLNSVRGSLPALQATFAEYDE